MSEDRRVNPGSITNSILNPISIIVVILKPITIMDLVLNSVLSVRLLFTGGCLEPRACVYTRGS